MYIVKVAKNCVDFILVYPSCFLVLILSSSYCGTENEKSRKMGVYEKGFF